MHKQWNIFVLFTVSLFLFTCLIPSGHVMAAQWEDVIEKQVKTIQHLIDQEKWADSVEPAKKLKVLFKKNKWKYQLLGDEGEYEQLNQEIEKLQMAINEKDSTQSKIILSTIRTIIQDIYGL